MGRSVLAVMAGAGVALGLMAALAGVAMRVAGHFPSAPNLTYMVVSIAALACAGGVGGYVAALIASTEEEWHAGVVAALLLGVGVAAALRGDGSSVPRWAMWLLAIIAPAGAILGARLHAPPRTRPGD